MIWNIPNIEFWLWHSIPLNFSCLMIPLVPFFLLEEDFSIQIVYFQLVNENHFLSYKERNYQLNVSYRKIFVFLLSLILWVEYKDATWCFLPFAILQVLLVIQTKLCSKAVSLFKALWARNKWIKTYKIFNAGCCSWVFYYLRFRKSKTRTVKPTFIY